MDSQKVFHFGDCSGFSFRRTPESRNIKGFLDADERRHGEKQTFPSFSTSSFHDLLEQEFEGIPGFGKFQSSVDHRIISCIWIELTG